MGEAERNNTIMKWLKPWLHSNGVQEDWLTYYVYCMFLEKSTIPITNYKVKSIILIDVE